MAALPFIDESHFESVRRVIDVALSDEEVPDEVIADDVYLLRGAQQVLLIDPLAETRTGNEEKAIQMATIFMVASLIVPALPQIMTEQFVDYRAKFEQFSPQEKVSALRNAAFEQLNFVKSLGDPSKAPRLTGFSLAVGRRGR